MSSMVFFDNYVIVIFLLPIYLVSNYISLYNFLLLDFLHIP